MLGPGGGGPLPNFCTRVCQHGLWNCTLSVAIFLLVHMTRGHWPWSRVTIKNLEIKVAFLLGKSVPGVDDSVTSHGFWGTLYSVILHSVSVVTHLSQGRIANLQLNSPFIALQLTSYCVIALCQQILSRQDSASCWLFDKPANIKRPDVDIEGACLRRMEISQLNWRGQQSGNCFPPLVTYCILDCTARARIIRVQ